MKIIHGEEKNIFISFSDLFTFDQIKRMRVFICYLTVYSFLLIDGRIHHLNIVVSDRIRIFSIDRLNSISGR